MADVLIIGAGPSGLAAAKASLEEGLRPLVLECRQELGGVWRIDGGAAWPGMRANLSRHSCSFSDYRWPDNASLFPTQAEMNAYLRSYAAAFGINEYIVYQARVARLGQAGLGWEAVLDDARVLKAPRVIVASGFFSSPRFPTVTDIEIFSGAISHSTAFRGAAPFAGQRVTVVGSAYSGCEIAAELASAGIAVTQIVRRPQWILSRMAPDDRGAMRALDLAFYSRKPASAPPVSPEEANRRRAHFFERTFGNPGDAHEDLRMNPESGEATYAAVSDDYLRLVRSGDIKIVRGIVHKADVDGLVVSGSSGPKHVPSDALVFATGIGCDLGFLDRIVQSHLAYDPTDSLQPILTHKGCFHPALPNFGLVGMYRGPYFAIIELQARRVAASFVDPALRPSDAELAAGVEEERAIRSKSPRPQFPRGDYVAFADHLARQIGIWPDIAHTDELYGAVSSGPVVPAHYRLCGRHAKRALAEAIIRQVSP